MFEYCSFQNKDRFLHQLLDVQIYKDKNNFKIEISKYNFELKMRSYCSTKVRPCLWNVILHPIEFTFTKQYGNFLILKILYLHKNFLLHFWIWNTSDWSPPAKYLQMKE